MIAGILLLPQAEAQLSAVQFYGAGDMAVNKRLAVTSALSYGGGVTVSYTVMDDAFLVLDIGYANYSIDQDNVDNRWGWGIWDRRYKNWVNIYSADTANFRSSIVSVQNMESIPVSLKIGYLYYLTNELWFSPMIGLGAEFYTRKLYHEETWTRKYPTIGYEYTYSFHNFAPYKYGNPLFAVGGLKGSLNISQLIKIDAGISYKVFIHTSNMLGYDNFPFNSALSFQLGIGLKY